MKYTLKDGKTKEKDDFDVAELSIKEFVEHAGECFSGFKEHHADAKWQAADWALVQKTFPPSTFVSVQDFSENLAIEVKMEHQSKYYAQVGVTLYAHTQRAPH